MSVGDFCRVIRLIDKIAVQNLLGSGELNTARKSGPGPSSENSVSDTFPLGGKTNNLLEDGFPFLVHSATSLENDRGEIVIRFLKTGSISIFWCWAQGSNLLRWEAARGHSEASAEAPVLD
jgi:hypothetical protein